jgi:hypothetical protein
MRTTKLYTFLTVLTVLAFVAGPANATLTITDLNSSVTIDPGSQLGMYTWTVDGVNQLYKQWFWFRIGATGGEASIDTLGTPVVSSGGRTAEITYTGSGLEINILYTLTGGSPGQYTSDIAESIRIMNNSASSSSIHFFQYSDFDLGGHTGDQTVQMVNANTVDQFSGQSQLSETIATPPPNQSAVGYFADLMASLTDLNPTNLNTFAPGPYTGDAAWAFQWDFNIGVGQSLLISKDKHLSQVPEPATILGLGTLLLLVGRKLQKRLA